ncbi:MAG: hypothetical protein AVDCRST_MAG75-528 [uncultured Propionibacteriaceae bacterium]|uniref:Uncharacterized protein n=1 Tax=uncultured Propionibacteriaceae bacterium TaxID=257457 RepID=A0A6J4N2X6_9ACTN|nr:MAG: hypothetical protein AVDCRST_MAG75-528 [uncultured Propionibacteriaceae bacterium]
MTALERATWSARTASTWLSRRFGTPAADPDKTALGGGVGVEGSDRPCARRDLRSGRSTSTAVIPRRWRASPAP